MLFSLSLVRDEVRMKVTHLPIPESCYSSIPKLHMWSELQLLLEDKWHPVPLKFYHWTSQISEIISILIFKEDHKASLFSDSV